MLLVDRQVGTYRTLKLLLEVITTMWLQNDGAPCHFYGPRSPAFKAHGPTRAHLDRKFRRRWNERQRPIDWLALSPDLKSIDFFMRIFGIWAR